MRRASDSQRQDFSLRINHRHVRHAAAAYTSLQSLRVTTSTLLTIAITLHKPQRRLIAITFSHAALNSEANSTLLVRNGIDQIYAKLGILNASNVASAYQVGADIAGGLTALMMAKQDLDYEQSLETSTFVDPE